MRKDYIYALMLAVFGFGSGIALMALPFYLQSQFPNGQVPTEDWVLYIKIGLCLAIISLAFAVVMLCWPTKTMAALEILGSGGRGGNAKTSGRHSGAEGGSGGQGGLGNGGDGGHAEANGDFSYARGGDGGNAAQIDGRGGRRSRSPAEALNLPSSTWKYGCGGTGANQPEYNRRVTILIQIRNEYMSAFPDDAVFINAGIDQVPINWINKRLDELNESWRVRMGDGGYVMPSLNQERNTHEI